MKSRVGKTLEESERLPGDTGACLFFLSRHDNPYRQDTARRLTGGWGLPAFAPEALRTGPL